MERTKTGLREFDQRLLLDRVQPELSVRVHSRHRDPRGPVISARRYAKIRRANLPDGRGGYLRAGVRPPSTHSAEPESGRIAPGTKKKGADRGWSGPARERGTMRGKAQFYLDGRAGQHISALRASVAGMFGQLKADGGFGGRRQGSRSRQAKGKWSQRHVLRGEQGICPRWTFCEVPNLVGRGRQ